MLVLSMHMLYC